MVKRAMGLKKDNDEGVRAFSFTELNSRDLRRRLKHAVNNELKLSKGEEEKILKESEEVFNRNNLLVGTVQNSQSFNDAVRKWSNRMRSTGAILLSAFVLKCIWRQKR